MTNNVRLTFSVGDTTWRVVYDKYWERQIELVALNTIFNVVVATKRLLNRSFIGFLQDWSNKYCGWLGCYIWSLTSQKKMGQVSNLLNFDLTFTLIDNSPSSMWRKFVRKHTAILRLLYKMKGSRHINVKLLKKERPMLGNPTWIWAIWSYLVQEYYGAALRWGKIIILRMMGVISYILRATSHTRLRARDHYTFKHSHWW